MHSRKLVFLGVFLATWCFSYTVQAKERSNQKKHVKTEPTESSIEYSQAGLESTYSTRSGNKWEVGFSTVQNTIPNAGIGALTGIYEFDPYNAVQVLFSIQNTSPFNAGGAGVYKRTIAQTRTAGFHVGGGIGMASVKVNGLNTAFFAMNLSAIVGFHFELPGVPHVAVHLDGGPTLNVINSSPVSTTSFQVGALSPALGASILYIF